MDLTDTLRRPPGLLTPILISPAGEILSGLRRLYAIEHLHDRNIPVYFLGKQLTRYTIPCLIADISPLDAQILTNLYSEPLHWSDKLRLLGETLPEADSPAVRCQSSEQLARQFSQELTETESLLSSLSPDTPLPDKNIFFSCDWQDVLAALPIKSIDFLFWPFPEFPFHFPIHYISSFIFCPASCEYTVPNKYILNYTMMIENKKYHCYSHPFADVTPYPPPRFLTDFSCNSYHTIFSRTLRPGSRILHPEATSVIYAAARLSSCYLLGINPDLNHLHSCLKHCIGPNNV